MDIMPDKLFQITRTEISQVDPGAETHAMPMFSDQL